MLSRKSFLSVSVLSALLSISSDNSSAFAGDTNSIASATAAQIRVTKTPLVKAGKAGKNDKKADNKADKKEDKVPDSNNSSFRLPDSVRPLSYELSVEPDLKKFTFSGQEQILVTISSQTDTILLNAAELRVTDVFLSKVQEVANYKPGFSDGKPPKAAPKVASLSDRKQPISIQFNAEQEQVKFVFKSKLGPGTYKLSCRFEGKLKDDLRGFYRSAYSDQSGKKHYLATTQMEATDARRMFPCFDEPEFKATYQLIVTMEPGLTAISNAPIAKSEKNSFGKNVVTFEPTPKMSSYLVALIVGDLRPSKSKIAAGIPITVWTVPGKESLAEYALDTACEILPVEQNYFGIPYPGKKLDLIALPDFDASAMENLGAITFREAILLVDSKAGTNFLKRKIASVEAHEIAHQWFGDLVTMRWWDDLWLNEAFATWMATKTIDKIRPEWRFLTRAVIDDRERSMADDQLQSTRAIHADVGDPAQAVEMFDGITYEKGASILRMLEAFVTPETFQRGIHDYLSAHAFANAKTEELWQSIGAATKGKIPVPEVMRPWVYQAGFPLLTVGSQEPSKLISIEQCRYLQAPDAVRSNSLWSIPIVFHGLSGASDSSKEPSKASQFTAVSSSSLQKLLNLRKDSVELANNTLPAFANKDGNGFYRVRYAQQDFEKIANNFSELTPEERLAFFSDTKALAVAGLTNLDNWLNLLLKVKFEKDPLVASQIVACYGALYPAMDSKSQPSYQKFIAGNLKTLKDSLGWQPKAGESESTKDLRAEVSQMIGTYGQDKETIREAFALFNQYMADRNAVNPDLVPTVLRIVAYNGGTQEYAQILAAWKSAKSPEDEKRFLLNLCDFRDKELVARTLDLILDGQIRAQDAPLVLSKLLSDRQNGKQAWQFTKTNWSKILKALPPTKMDRVASACSNFYLRSDEDDLKTFFANHKVPFGESALARALEDVHINVMFFERSAEQIRQWVGSQAQAVDADKT